MKPAGRARVAVTGAGGFIGRRLADMLEQSGAEIRRITRRGPPLDDAPRLLAALSGCTALVHCAFDAYDEAANLRIAQTLGEVCAAARIRLVHVSTAAVYEPLPDGVLTEAASTDAPGTAYKASKLAIERRLLDLVATDGLDLVVLQPTIVYGPRGGAWTDSPVRELLTSEVWLPDAGRGSCNAVYVDDVCRAAMAACQAELRSGERLLVSGPAPVTWQAFFGAYQVMLGTDSLRYEPPSSSLDQNVELSGRSLDRIVEPPGRSLDRTALPGRSCDQTEPPSRSCDQTESPGRSLDRAGPPAAASRQRLKRLLLGRLGAIGRTRLNYLVQRLRFRLLGRKALHATGAKRALYEARCCVDTAKAERLLGFRPQVDLASGMAATRGYVQGAYGKAGGNPLSRNGQRTFAS